MFMLDNKIASGDQLRTKDDLDALEPSRMYKPVKSDTDVMIALSNTQRRRSSESTLASRTYLELLPSMEDMPTPPREKERTESPARPAIELDRYALSRLPERVVLTMNGRREFGQAHVSGQSGDEPRGDGGGISPLFHVDDSWDSDDLLTDFDDDAYEFTPAPLRVGRGVSVTEESVETGVPDLVTQM